MTTPEEQRTAELKVLAANQHDRWLHDSTTAAVRVILDKEIEGLSKYVSDRAASDDVTDHKLRWQLNQLNALRRVRELIFDTNMFLTKTFDTNIFFSKTGKQQYE